MLIDPSVKPDVIADLRRPFEHFKPLEFDTVLCDPPFSFYNKFKWILRIADLASKRLILCTPTVVLSLSPKFWKKQYYITEENTLFMRIWQVFDKTSCLLASPSRPLRPHKKILEMELAKQI